MNKLLPSKYFEAIGEISVNFGYLERTLLSTISKTTSLEISLINRLIAGDNFDVLVSKVNKSFIYVLHSKNLQTAELLAEIKSIIKRLDKINEKRNRLMHSFWFLDEDGNVTMTKFKRRIKDAPGVVDTKTITLEDLQDFDNEITDCVHLLGRFKKKIIKLLSK